MTRPVVRGAVVDGQTRCVHYRTVLDVVAIRFHCCGEFYPCHRCHAEVPGQHAATPWPAPLHDARALLCGVCGTTLPITEYLSRSDCPGCGARFNPGCLLHAGLYFETAGS
ncbi:CHY zinc finger protein [Arthrobacter rhombi]|uniref:CHY zinc finger protein n=1 Tax=Arthrobacter rhombi TaxID=71253 RepID=UPI0031D2A3EF